MFINQNHFSRKIKLNKQPSILDKTFARNFSPYTDLTDEEIDLKCKQQLEKKNSLKILTKF